MSFLSAIPMWLAQLEMQAHWSNVLWTVVAYVVLLVARRERSR